MPGGGDYIALKADCIPLLANFTYEDKAATGLRKRTVDDEPEPPVYFSSLEVSRDSRFLLLSGKGGSGKTTLAKYLCYSAATAGLEKPRPVIRNETEIVKEESWGDFKIEPYYYTIDCFKTLKRMIDEVIPEAFEGFAKRKLNNSTML